MLREVGADGTLDGRLVGGWRKEPELRRLEIGGDVPFERLGAEESWGTLRELMRRAGGLRAKSRGGRGGASGCESSTVVRW